MIASLIGIAIVDLGLTPRDPFRRRQPQRILDRARPEVRGGLFQVVAQHHVQFQP